MLALQALQIDVINVYRSGLVGVIVDVGNKAQVGTAARQVGRFGYSYKCTAVVGNRTY